MAYLKLSKVIRYDRCKSHPIHFNFVLDSYSAVSKAHIPPEIACLIF
jgi:hypothetical protein